MLSLSDHLLGCPALQIPRGVQAYFRTFVIFLGLGRSKKLPCKNDPEPRVVIFPKYDPVGIIPEPIQARFHVL